MDHRQTLDNVYHRTLRSAVRLPAVLAATEETPLRSPTIDGGSRPIGAHSDPTPSAALRRRRTEERRRLDQLYRELDDTSARIEALETKVTALPTKTGTCRTCVRQQQILTPPHSICIHCVKAIDKARRRWSDQTVPFDPAIWVERRFVTLRTKATGAA